MPRRSALPPASSTCFTSSASAKCRSRSAATRTTQAPDPHHPRRRSRHARDGEAKPGDTLGVRGPYRQPAGRSPKPPGNDVVIVAGGIGLAPLRPVVYHVLKRRKEFGKVVLLYGARTPQDILFRDELRALARAARPACADHGGPRVGRLARATSVSSPRSSRARRSIPTNTSR